MGKLTKNQNIILKMKALFLTISILQISSCFSQNTIFWSIKKPESSNTSYLLGTYHQMGNSYADSLKTVTRALSNADIAIFENIDTGEGITNLLNARNDDFTYRKELNKSDLKYLDEISKNWKVSVSKLSSSELIMKIQQTYFETQCGTVKNTDSINNFDNYLIKLAKQSEVELWGLESDSLITSYINQSVKPDWESHKKEISIWLQNIKKSEHTREYCAFASSYMKQEIDYQLKSECSDSLLINTRSKIWIPLLINQISNKNAFIAVGISHLFGKCGLISQLQELGYIVEPLYNLHK